ncbi:MAG: chromosome partitioning protein ParA [Deltaproteobacteria bacterium]|nr:MAG: chromosome partitioning protein ParA [Deltaproteobacteria bacterium]
MAAQDQAIQESLSLIKNKFLVMSGKGGVGKTSVAANLAVALSKKGAKVGLMDVDLHGPDIPRMLGLKGLLEISADNRMIPKPYSDHLKVVSIESLTQDTDEAVIWRGPLKMHVIRQFISDVHWGQLDYLVIDSPPGTGDEPLSVAQTIPGAKAIIVTTPQEVSLADIRKSINFCRTVNMPIFGLIENMSGFVCPHCGKPVDLFGTGGGFRTALAMNVPFLGRIPFDPKMVACADAGESYLEKYSDSELTKAYNEIVAKILEGDQTTTSEPQSTHSKIQEKDTKEEKVMKIAIPVAEGRLTPHFGHAAEFAIVHVENQEIKKKELLTPPPHEPGVLPRWLHELGVNVIIAGGMGQKALSLFGENGIQVITGAPNLTPEELVHQYLANTLVTGANVCDH